MGTPKFGQTTKCICLTTTFLARDICEDPSIPLKIKAMLHDLYLWFSLLLIRLRKGVWKLRWWAAIRYLPKLFISVRILGIMHQKLTRIGLPRSSLVCYCMWRSCICSLQCRFGAIYSSLMIWNHFIGADSITYIYRQTLVLEVYHVDFRIRLSLSV